MPCELVEPRSPALSVISDEFNPYNHAPHAEPQVIRPIRTLGLASVDPIGPDRLAYRPDLLRLRQPAELISL